MTITVATAAIPCDGKDWQSGDFQRVGSSVSVSASETKPKRTHLHHILDTPVGKWSQIPSVGRLRPIVLRLRPVSNAVEELAVAPDALRPIVADDSKLLARHG